MDWAFEVFLGVVQYENITRFLFGKFAPYMRFPASNLQGIARELSSWFLHSFCDRFESRSLVSVTPSHDILKWVSHFAIQCLTERCTTAGRLLHYVEQLQVECSDTSVKLNAFQFVSYTVLV